MLSSLWMIDWVPTDSFCRFGKEQTEFGGWDYRLWGQKRGAHIPTVITSVPMSETISIAILLPCPSHFGIIIAKAPNDPLVLTMAPSDSLQSSSLLDHVCPGSGGSLYPYNWDSPVRRGFWRMSLATDVVQASMSSPNHSMAKGLARNSYQKWH